jgi:hypothetical protein
MQCAGEKLARSSRGEAADEATSWLLAFAQCGSGQVRQTHVSHADYELEELASRQRPRSAIAANRESRGYIFRGRGRAQP